MSADQQRHPMSDKLTDALEKFNTMMAHLGGCLDGGCVIKQPTGMHTNGGCRCPQDKLKMQRAMYAANDLRDAVSAFLAASPAPAIPAEPSEDAIDAVRAVLQRNSVYFSRPSIEAIVRAALKAAPAISESEDARDAARYRWLRRQPNTTEAPRIDVVQWSEIDESANEGHGLRMEDLDAAIDAARKGDKS